LSYPEISLGERVTFGAPFFSAAWCGDRVGLGDGVSSRPGVGDFFLCFRFVPGVALGDGVGEVFLCFGEAVGVGVGDGVGEIFFRLGVAVGDRPEVVFLF
jgi:hypothetical protein